MQNCGIFQLHFTLVLQVSPPAPDPAGSVLQDSGVLFPFRLFVLYNFHTFVQLLPPKCATHLLRRIVSVPSGGWWSIFTGPACHAHRPQPPPVAANCILLPQMRVCVLENRVSTISTLGFAHLMPSYNFHVGCFSSFHPQSCPRELRGPIKTSRRGVKCHLCIEDLRCIFQCLINIILAQFIM